MTPPLAASGGGAATWHNHPEGDGLLEPVLVYFVVPVEATHPGGDEVRMATCHRVVTSSARQDGARTVFLGTGGEVVASWQTCLVDRIVWPAQLDARRPMDEGGHGDWRDEVKVMFPRAWEPWTAEEQAQVVREFHEGLPVGEMGLRHERRPNAILARLVALGLVGADTSETAIARSSSPTYGSRPVGAQRSSLSAAAPTDSVEFKELTDRRTPERAVDDECLHGLLLGTCKHCALDALPNVFITGGGTHYHARSDCPALAVGQRLVEERGGTPDPIEQVHRGSARLEGRSACKTCRPR